MCNEISCTKLQLPPKPLARGYRPQIPFLYVLCPQLNLLSPPNKIPGYATVNRHLVSCLHTEEHEFLKLLTML